MRIVFMGSPNEVIPPLAALHKSTSHDLVAVVSQPARPSGRGGTPQDPPVAVWAKEHGVLCLQPLSAKTGDFLGALRDLKPDVIVTAAYGQILTDEFLKIPSRGTINIHPSKLPRHRGATPVPQSILDGDTSTAVTILFTVKKLDAGPIIVSKEFEISPTERAGDLTARLFNESVTPLFDSLTLLGDPSFTGVPQNDEWATICRKIDKESGEVEWSAPTRAIFNRFRAYDPWPGCWTFLNDRRIGIIEMLPVSSPAGGLPGTFYYDKPTKSLLVDCQDYQIKILFLKPAGGKVMDAASFWNGLRDKSQNRFHAHVEST